MINRVILKKQKGLIYSFCVVFSLKLFCYGLQSKAYSGLTLTVVLFQMPVLHVVLGLQAHIRIDLKTRKKKSSNLALLVRSEC